MATKKPARKGLPPKSQKTNSKNGSQTLVNLKTSPKSKSSPNLGTVLQVAKTSSSAEKTNKRQREDNDTEPNKKKKTGKDDRSMEVCVSYCQIEIEID